MDTLEHQVNRALSALGIAITASASTTASWFNTFQFIVNGIISPFVSPAAAPSLANATKILPNLGTPATPQTAGVLASDTGSVDTGIKSCRMYTLVATLPLNDGSTVPTFSWLAGDDFSKFEFPAVKYIAMPNQSNQAAIAFVYVKNETGADFVAGTTHLDAASLTVEYFEYSVNLGTGSALANGDIWVGDAGGNAVARAASGDATISNTGVIAVVGSTTAFNFTGKLTATHSASSGAAAVPLTKSVHEITTTGTGNALTLADGIAGQELTLLYVAESAGGDTAILTPANLAGGNTITFNALGDTALLRFSTTGGWYFVAGSAVLA